MQYVDIDFDDQTVFFDQSADPVDLQARVQARVDSQAGTSRPNLCRVLLAGAGDGHTFVCQTSFCGVVPDSLEDSALVFYMASDAENLALARAAAVSGLAASNKADEPTAGASKGTRFMVVVVTGEPVGR